MVSPWKFFARLVSSRRQPKQDDSAIEAVKPDVLAIAGPNETPAEASRHITDQAAGEQPQPLHRSAAAPTAHGQPDETRRDAAGIVEHDSDKLDTASGTVFPDVGVIVAKVEDTAKATRRPERRTRAQKVEAAAVLFQGSPVAASASDEMVSLDEEIAALRTQLASKLRLQNTQLKKMLARFER